MKKKHTALTISLIIFACLAVLALLCWLWPASRVRVGNLELKWPTLSEVLGTPNDTLVADADTLEIDLLSDTIKSVPAPIALSEPQPEPEQEQKSEEEQKPEPKPKPQRAEKPIITIDTTDLEKSVTSLNYLAAALQQADSVPVRVVYYGDSQIEGDRMTMSVRRALQKAYGGGGVGLLPLHQTVSSRTVIQTLKLSDIAQSTGSGPRRYMAFGPKSARRDSKVYGPMAQCAVMDDSLQHGSERALWTAYAQKKKNTESYFNRVRVLAAPTIAVSVHNAQKIGAGLYALKDSSTAVTVSLNGKGDVYGICLETNHGITVDNVPMRGCAGTIFTSINSKELRDYYRMTNTRLIILQYGGNVVPYTKTTKQVNSYIERVRAQIRFLKKLAPETDFVFVGPSDMVDKSGTDVHTHPAVPAMDASLAKMCAEEGVLYYSLFHAMGGSGAMQAWKTRGWAGSDLVHFTRQGADKAGDMLALWLIDRLKMNDQQPPANNQ